MRKPKYDDFHLSMPVHFELLRMTDKKNEITADHYYAFNVCPVDRPCNETDHTDCLKRNDVYCTENPLNRAYNAYIKKNGRVTVGSYLNRRIYELAVMVADSCLHLCGR